MGELFPNKAQTDRRPDPPGGITPYIEVIPVAYLAVDVGRTGILRPAVLEIHVVDEGERHREHERSEIPESFSVPPPMDAASDEPEHQKHECDHELRARHCCVRVTQPLPFEVE